MPPYPDTPARSRPCVLSIVGARPQFVKLAPFSHALQAAGATGVILHTGQHYDAGMSQLFFEELEIPAPDINLGVGSGTHGVQTARMIEGIEKTIQDLRPSVVVVFGETNSTLAGALAESKMGIPIAHIEAGLRSFNRAMPEEINRIVTDVLSNLLLCPTPAAAIRLRQETVVGRVEVVGDIMVDAHHHFLPHAMQRSSILERLGLPPRTYILSTLHRAENTDRKDRLERILTFLGTFRETVVLPLHPRTRTRMREFGLSLPLNVHATEPLGYLDMLRLQASCLGVATDSGGLQKEAYLSKVPCLTLRNETEWVETLKTGWNHLVPIDLDPLPSLPTLFREPPSEHPPIFGDWHASERIVALILETVANHTP